MNLKGIKLTWLGHSTFRIENPGRQDHLHRSLDHGQSHVPGGRQESEESRHPARARTVTETTSAMRSKSSKQHNPVVVGIYELCLWLAKKGAKADCPHEQRGNANGRRY